MPITFSTDNDNNDFELDNYGNFKLITELNAVMNLCKAAIEVRLGEMIFKIDEGMPFFETVFKGHPNIARFKSAVKQTLLAIDGVQEITTLEFSVTQNILNYRAIIVTIYGTGQLNGNL